MIRRLLAYFRLSKAAVCAESVGRGLHDDFHDYPDAIVPYPWHEHVHTCARCGKGFCV